MGTTALRALLSGLAAGPAILYATLPDGVRDNLLQELGSPGVLTGLAVFGLAVGFRPAAEQDIAILFAPGQNATAVSPEGGTEKALHDLTQALMAKAPAVGPQTEGEATAHLLKRVLANHTAAHPNDLAPQDLRAVHLLYRTIRTTPAQAGEFAQYFRDPHAILALRDDIQTIQRRRETFEQQTSVYTASCVEWERQTTDPAQSLAQSLDRLEAPDPDLFHQVIATHDPSDPAQRAAALVCASNAATAHASLALYLSRIASEGQLPKAVARKDAAWLQGVRDVINAWNAGRYLNTEIGFDTSNRVLHDAALLAEAFDTLATLTDSPRWPMPLGLFCDYPGRLAQMRPAWSIAQGRLRARPHKSDYISVE